jgi:hypothetical protein
VAGATAPIWPARRRALTEGQALQGGRQARAAIGRGDTPGDEFCRSHKGLEGGHQLDVRWRAHELAKRSLVLLDRQGPVVAGKGFRPQHVSN